MSKATTSEPHVTDLLMTRLQRSVIRQIAGRARREARSKQELFDRLVKFAIADTKYFGYSEDRLRYIAREFLGAVH